MNTASRLRATEASRNNASACWALRAAAPETPYHGSRKMRQTAVACLLYAMGRDSVLPKRIFGYIHPKFHTPAINVLLAGLVGLIVLELNVAASTSFINFGAFSAFTFVNLCVIAMFIRQRREHGPSQRVVPHVVFPAIGAVVDVYLLLHLDGKAKLLGLGWLTLGVLYLTYLTRGFRRPPPEMDFVEE